MNICTWNCQGDPTDPRTNKLEILDSLLGIYDVVLLQECGKKIEEARLKCYCHRYPHAGAYHQRCSMAILTRKKEDSFEAYYRDTTGRPIQEIVIGKTVIYNIHANASTGEGANTLLTMMTTKLQTEGIETAVAGGDWNRTPEEQKKLFNEPDRESLFFGSNTFSFKCRHDNINMQFVTPSIPTQRGGNILDYFIVAGKAHPLRACDALGKDIKTFCSDHIPIGFTLP